MKNYSRERAEEGCQSSRPAKPLDGGNSRVMLNRNAYAGSAWIPACRHGLSWYWNPCWACAEVLKNNHNRPRQAAS